MCLETLKTERLLLRPLLHTDAAAIFTLRSDDIVNRFLDRPKAKSIKDANDFITKILTAPDGSFYWALALAESNQLIGTICLWNISDDKTNIEIGFEQMSAYHGQGFMTEALSRVIKYGFENFEYKTICGYTSRKNTASINLLTRAGFKQLPDGSKDDCPVDMIVLELVNMSA